jgi:8-oxo-dGTP diphosphatase
MGRAVTRAPRRAGAADGLVRAAGGIVLREVRPGRFEVAVIHRPDRDDWSFPKGKLDEGEWFEDCALREVQEETGYRCRLVRFVGFTEYRDRRDRPKVVGYWHMEVLDGEFRPSVEVDDMRWLDLDIAARALTYRRDRELLSALDPVVLARSG